MITVNSSVSRDELKVAIGQKLMIDLRYFDNKDLSVSASNNLVGYQTRNNTRSGVTKLPCELAALLCDLNIGGVILFAENCETKPQIKQLTHAIQQCAMRSEANLPALISIDQEGGRVTRLPKAQWPSFSGNMAIGAVSENSRDCAFENGRLIGEQLAELGINVNHAPTVDVNINHANPVINVRSFGDDPSIVGDLGIATAKGLKHSSVLATFKHFPGHGDTHTDSHTGLPCVNHNEQTIESVDLKPFQQAIDADECSLIMTAHIQYPVLDSSTIITKRGQAIVRPATLSREIITETLRNRMGFKGLVITDALDMASISDFLTPLDAVLETFRAGADIALMPFKVHNPDGIKRFYELVDCVVENVIADEALTAEILGSFQRIRDIKQTLAQPTKSMNYLAHRLFENKLAQDSLINLAHNQSIHLRRITSCNIVMPSIEQALAFKYAIMSVSDKELLINCYSLQQLKNVKARQDQMLIIGLEDKRSVVDAGGMDDLDKDCQQQIDQDSVIKTMQHSNEVGGGSVFISLKAPYHCQRYINIASISLASFDANCYQTSDGQWKGAAFDALSMAIFKKIEVTGTLPINITQ